VSAPQSFTLTVQEGPTITSANTATFTTGVPGSFTVITSGFPAPALLQTGALPAGVTFVDNGDGTGTLAGTPASGSSGAYALTVTATNSAGPSTQQFTLMVDEPPEITSADAATFTVGVSGEFIITSTGFPTPTLARGGDALPLGLTYANNGDGTATLSGTPGSGTGGVYTLTFTANSSAGASPPQTFTLTILEVPAITSAASANFVVGAFGSFTVTTSGYPTPTLEVDVADIPAGVTFVDNGDGTGTLSGTPTSNGSFPLALTATNMVGSFVPQSFTLVVGQAPAISSAASTNFVVGTFGSFTVTTSGFPPPSITHGGGALPAGVTFVDNGDGTGTLSGTPGAGTASSYALTFDASNSFGASAQQSFTLTVQGSLVRAGSPNLAASLSANIGTLPAGKQVTIQFDVTIASPLPIGVGQLSNQGSLTASGLTAVLTDDPRRPGAADPTITTLGARKIYMPLIMRGVGPPLPDLVVSSITISDGSLQVTISNNGQLAATEPFWVDGYINPTSAPVRTNQLWNNVGTRGVSWGVVGSVLPLEPGETLTLAVGDPYYRSRLSNPGGPITAGTQLYAQVDSFSTSGSNGTVLEIHERDAGVYNNILGPVAAP
jgi:hypothetical protein